MNSVPLQVDILPEDLQHYQSFHLILMLEDYPSSSYTRTIYEEPLHKTAGARAGHCGKSQEAFANKDHTYTSGVRIIYRA